MRKALFMPFSLLAILLVAFPSASSAQVSLGISVHIGPPALPVYTQPLAPGPGYIWTPGYWAYGPDGYYWVPGTWVFAPVGMLWTPGYWGFAGGVYAWHAGYWGPHVGFYGGVNYGFGYGGVGFVGGRWDHGAFAYNTAVSNVNVTVVHNTYVDKTVIVNNTTVNRVSYNGGPGGLNAQPTAQERIAENDHHVAMTNEQVQHEHSASTNRAFLASENHGRPAVAATARPGEFTGHDVSTSRGAPGSFHPPANGNGSAHAENASHTPNNGGGPHPANAGHPQNDKPHNNPPKNEHKDEGDHEHH
jgi:YXWGXW repeat-containing protein